MNIDMSTKTKADFNSYHCGVIKSNLRWLEYKIEDLIENKKMYSTEYFTLTLLQNENRKCLRALGGVE